MTVSSESSGRGFAGPQTRRSGRRVHCGVGADRDPTPPCAVSRPFDGGIPGRYRILFDTSLQFRFGNAGGRSWCGSPPRASAEIDEPLQAVGKSSSAARRPVRATLVRGDFIRSWSRHALAITARGWAAHAGRECRRDRGLAVERAFAERGYLKVRMAFELTAHEPDRKFRGYASGPLRTIGESPAIPRLDAFRALLPDGDGNNVASREVA